MMDIVIDTNVLVAGLLSPFGTCGKIVRMVSAGELILSFDARILSEYNEVLRRPRFGFEEEKIAAFLDYIVYRGRAVAPFPLSHSLPDPDDEPFLEVALASHAVCLITGNQKHFPAERCQDAKVISPNEFLIFFKNQQTDKKRITVSFRDECMDRIRSFLNVDLIKNSFATFLNEKEGIGVVCSISKVHESGHRKGYWFAFHPYQKEFLDKFKKGYLAFGCGSSETILLIPFKEISSELDKLNVTRKEDRFYWHVHIGEDGKKLILSTKQDFGKIELTKYLLKSKTA